MSAPPPNINTTFFLMNGVVHKLKQLLHLCVISQQQSALQTPLSQVPESTTPLEQGLFHAGTKFSPWFFQSTGNSVCFS